MLEQTVRVEYRDRLRVGRVVVVDADGVEWPVPMVLEVRRVIRDGERPRVELVVAGHLEERPAARAEAAAVAP